MAGLFPYGENVCLEKEACIDLATGRRWTYRSLEICVHRAAEFLSFYKSIPTQGQTRYNAGLGLERGDRVAILAKNSVYHLILFLAAMRMGFIFVPLNWRLQPKELHGLLEDCAPTVLFAEDPASVDQILPRNCELFKLENLITAVGEAASVSGSDAESVVTTKAPQRHELRYVTEHGAVCLLLYTSGSTGAAKGVQHTVKSLHATIVNFSAAGSISADKTPVFLVDAPMYHVIGGVVCTLVPLSVGGKILISDKFEAARTHYRLADTSLGVTHYFCVPTMADALSSLADFEPESWASFEKMFTGGSSNAATRVRRWLDRGIQMVDGYGMTETGTICTMPTSSESIADVLRTKAGSVGLPAPLTQIRLQDSYGREVGVDTPGEIVVAGPNVSMGYWSAEPAPNHLVATRPGTAEGEPDRWLATGDIGLRDKDGFLYIVDRKKDMYISGGENVFPAEIESTILSHPLVRDVAVVGVPHRVWGEAGCAFVVALDTKRIEEDALLEYCRQRLARFKIPKHFLLVEELPRNSSGKALKKDLRDLFAGMNAFKMEKNSLDLGDKAAREQRLLGWCLKLMSRLCCS